MSKTPPPNQQAKSSPEEGMSDLEVSVQGTIQLLLANLGSEASAKRVLRGLLVSFSSSEESSTEESSSPDESSPDESSPDESSPDSNGGDDDPTTRVFVHRLPIDIPRLFTSQSRSDIVIEKSIESRMMTDPTTASSFHELLERALEHPVSSYMVTCPTIDRHAVIRDISYQVKSLVDLINQSSQDQKLREGQLDQKQAMIATHVALIDHLTVELERTTEKLNWLKKEEKIIARHISESSATKTRATTDEERLRMIGKALEKLNTMHETPSLRPTLPCAIVEGMVMKEPFDLEGIEDLSNIPTRRHVLIIRALFGCGFQFSPAHAKLGIALMAGNAPQAQLIHQLRLLFDFPESTPKKKPASKKSTPSSKTKSARKKTPASAKHTSKSAKKPTTSFRKAAAAFTASTPAASTPAASTPAASTPARTCLFPPTSTPKPS